MSRIFVFIIKLYKVVVSPLYVPTCRYVPTCSNYAQEAIIEWGSLKGGMLALKRIIKCGPWSKGGYDPVPRKKNQKDK